MEIGETPGENRAFFFCSDDRFVLVELRRWEVAAPFAHAQGKQDDKLAAAEPSKSRFLTPRTAFGMTGLDDLRVTERKSGDQSPFARDPQGKPHSEEGGAVTLREDFGQKPPLP
jgi:hypothetical protein